MSVGSILTWIICGVIVGMCARILVPGRQDMSLGMTTLLGVGGALLGGFLFSLVLGGSAEPFSPVAAHNWYGWIVAILGAVGLLCLHPYVYPKKWGS
jgi:uncharacterized membrane protein YeaQ/YmgE (transglycosylase-associated protein family)